MPLELVFTQESLEECGFKFQNNFITAQTPEQLEKSEDMSESIKGVTNVRAQFFHLTFGSFVIFDDEIKKSMPGAKCKLKLEVLRVAGKQKGRKMLLGVTLPPEVEEWVKQVKQLDYFIEQLDKGSPRKNHYLIIGKEKYSADYSKVLD